MTEQYTYEITEAQIEALARKLDDAGVNFAIGCTWEQAWNRGLVTFEEILDAVSARL